MKQEAETRFNIFINIFQEDKFRMENNILDYLLKKRKFVWILCTYIKFKQIGGYYSVQ